MSKLVLFDIDGTLVTNENYLPPSTIHAIKQLKANGHIPAISTGRPPKMLQPIAEALEIESFIAINGQYVLAEKEEILSQVIPHDVLLRLIDETDKRGDRLLLVTPEDIIGNQLMKEILEDPRFLTMVYEEMAKLDLDVVFEMFKRTTEKPFEIKNYENEQILTTFIHTTEENDSDYQALFPELHVNRSIPIMAEITLAGTNKASAKNILMNYLKIKPEDTIAFGDSLNDIEILQSVKTGVAMGNARPELKNIADFVTADVTDNGIEKGLKYLDLI